METNFCKHLFDETISKDNLLKLNFTKEQIIKIYGEGETFSFKDVWRRSIDSIIFKVDYSKFPNYKIERSKKNNQIGVLNLYKKRWVWSWINTINTNYSCFGVIFEFINTLVDDKISFIKYGEDNPKNLIKMLGYVRQYKEILFTPEIKNSVFDDLWLIADLRWNSSLINTLDTTYDLENNFGYKLHGKLDLERGDLEDMKSGVDFRAIKDESLSTFQDKLSTYLSKINFGNNDFVNIDISFSKNYNKLDIICIGKPGLKYYFDLTKRWHGLKNNTVEFKKDELIERVSNNQPYVDLFNELLNLNEDSYKNGIHLFFGNDNTGKNSITPYLNDKEIVIIINELSFTNIFINKVNELSTKMRLEYKEKKKQRIKELFQ